MRRPHRNPWTSRDSRAERGGVATIVAMFFMGASVIMGMLAVSIDLGNLTYERRQVQNAADATSLALAADCAADSVGCQPSAVEGLLGANSHDSLGRYDSRLDANAPNGACGRGVDSLPLCASDDGFGDIAHLTDCPPLAKWLSDSEVPYVETYAATLSDTGTELFMPFSRVLAGGDPSGDKGARACARAAWGPAGSTGSTLPIGIGACDWANKTSVGGVPGEKYAPPPPYSPEPNGGAPPSVPAVVADGDYVTGIFTHDSEDHKCEGSPGSAYPGGFGWLDNEDCVASFENDWAGGGPGTSEGCSASELKKYVGTEVPIPIYVDTKGTGDGAEYEISGVAMFYLAGWNEMSSAAPEKTYAVYDEPAEVCTGKCTGSVSYIWGWFTSGQLPAGTIDPDAGDFGVTVVQPAG